MDENDYSGDAIYLIYEDIKQRVDERHAMFARFARHAIAWVTIFIVLVLLDSGQNELPTYALFVSVVVMAAWLFMVGAHFVNWLLFELREWLLQREMKRSGIGLYQRRLAEKRKHEGHVPERLVRLTDDGEIVDLENDEEHEARYG